MELAEEVILDKIELAALHFRSRNFSKCLALYSEIEASLARLSSGELTRIRTYYHLSQTPIVGRLVHPKMSNVLDCKAAVFEKLGQSGEALLCAERIMEIDPLNCKGYLRACKLHLKKNETVQGYKCLQRGIYFIERAREKHRVDVSDKLLGQMKSQYRSINQYLKAEKKTEKTEKKEEKGEEVLKADFAPLKVGKASSFAGFQHKLDLMLPLKRAQSTGTKTPKRVRSDKDFMARLPPEVVEWIFALGSRSTLLKCHLVCLGWYHTLTAIPRLYKDIFTLKHRVTASEYFQGLRLMKKVLLFLYGKSIHSLSLWSTFNLVNFGRILENIISDSSLRLRKLVLVNQDLCFEFLLNKVAKCGWKFDALATVEHLRLGLNSSLPSVEAVLALFPNLKALDVLVIDCVLHGTNKHLLPLDTERTEAFLENARVTHAKLESLIYVNHPGLTREFQSARQSDRTYSAKPPFLHLQMDSLTKLTAVNLDFKGLQLQWGNFLSASPHLKELYLENNDDMDVKQLLTVLRLYEPGFRLSALTIREKPHNVSYSMAELDSEGLLCLFSLASLDIYGCSLSCRGLIKLLHVANHGSRLVSLNIGNSNFVYFRKDKFTTGHEVLNFLDVFAVVPGLKSLYLHELDLDNLSMKYLHQELVKETGYAECPLRFLDLSFCHQIDGIGLMNLMNAAYSQPNRESTLHLDELVLDGLDFNKETLGLLSRRKLVETIRNDPAKTKWRVYGINSLVQTHRG